MRFFSAPPFPTKICHLNRSLQYDKKAAYCLLTIEYLARIPEWFLRNGAAQRLE